MKFVLNGKRTRGKVLFNGAGIERKLRLEKDLDMLDRIWLSQSFDA